jgi:hypothetical protein
MKVWKIIGNGYYGQGMAVVAASDADSAREIASKIRDYWNCDYAQGETDLLDFTVTGKRRILCHFETGE